VRALVPAFRPVTTHIARNQTVSGVRVSWRIVPAVTEVCRPQAAHCHRRPTGQAFASPHPGQRNLSGHPTRSSDRMTRTEPISNSCGIRPDFAVVRHEGRPYMLGVTLVTWISNQWISNQPFTH
jgi:hypothetical protein